MVGTTVHGDMEIDGSQIVAAGFKNPTEANIHFNWHVSDICNYKCRYCSAGFGHDLTRPEMTTHRGDNKLLWRLVLNKLKAISDDYIMCLVGGEPTLHPQLHKIVEYLTGMENCKMLEITTNLTKPAQYFIDLPRHKKIKIHASIHFDYFKDSIIDKILLIDNFVNIQASVMLHDNKNHINKITRCLERLKYNNIKHECVMLHDIETHKIKYDKDQLSLLADETTIYKHEYRTDRGVYSLNQSHIRKNKLNRFKGWGCYAKGWDITPAGKILHSCTQEPISVEKINKMITCPHSSCKCAGFWDFTKQK